MPVSNQTPELPESLPAPIQNYIRQKHLTPELMEQPRQDIFQGYWIFKGLAYDSDGDAIEMPSTVVIIHDIESEETDGGEKLYVKIEAGRHGTVQAYLDEEDFEIRPL